MVRVTPAAAAVAAGLSVAGLAAAAAPGHRGRSARRPAGAPSAPSVPSAVIACCDAVDDAIDPAQAWRVLSVTLLVVPLVLLLATGPVPAALAAVGILAGPRLALPTLARRREARRDAQLAGGLEQLASAIRSGRSVRGALVDVASSTPRPLGDELVAVADALDHGASVDEALATWTARSGTSAEVRLAAAAIALGGHAGGEVARAFDGVAATLRERREVHGEVVALATQARASAGVLVLAPVGFAGLVSTIQPTTLSFLVTTPVGLGCLAVGLSLEVLGGWWMARIVRRAQ